MAVEYTILLRDPRTLALLGELPHYIGARWTRSDVEQGSMQLTVHRRSVDATLIARNTIVEVRRDGASEFAGMIRALEFDALADVWTLSGPCLKWWLAGRQLRPAAGQEYDSQAAVAAESAMKHYVADHLTAPVDASRNVNAELSGITFDIEPDQGRGATVSFNGRYVNLFSGCLSPLATAGELLHDVVLQDAYAGYRYQVSVPVDATRATGVEPVVFSAGWDNVGKLVYREDYTTAVNAISVLGQGTGALRTVREVTDAASIASDFRRETSADSRNNATNAALDQDGAAVLARALAETIQIDAEPLPVGPTLYREAWDLGYDVTLAIPEIGVEIDKRIVEVTVTLDANQGETISVALGSPARTQARIIAEALRRTNRVQVA